MSGVDMRWRLYVSEECELCDRAVAVLAGARAPDFESVSIENDSVLIERYGVRVPVLFDAVDGRELDWPFNVVDVSRFLGLDASSG